VHSAADGTSESVGEVPSQEVIELSCELYADLAGAVMAARQLRRPFFDVLGNADDSKSPEFRRIFTEIVTQAYETPVFSTEEYRQRAIADFTNDFSVMCFRTLGSGGELYSD